MEVLALTPFIDALPIPKVLSPRERRKGCTYYEVTMKEFEHNFHSEMPPTKIWGYEGQFPGPVIDVNRGEATHVKWLNDLPDEHLLPIDHSVHGAGEHMPQVRTVVHLHGAEVEPISDGYPEAWFTNNFKFTGPCFETPVYKYNNKQRASMLWYHDHAVGITRLNVYAGLVGMYLIRDGHERSLNLPAGIYEIPLIIADKGFNEDGSLFYPDDTNIPPPPHPDGFPHPSITPGETFESITVNGKVWPYFEVEQRKYRFRILNASNGRFYRMSLDSDQPFIQIGSDGGLLEKPVAMNEIIIGPSERVDVIIDFTDQPVDSKIVMRNTANSPFDFPPPIGQPPNSETDGQIMQFRVIASTGEDTSTIPTTLTKITRYKDFQADRIRDITLDVENDQFGRLRFLLNNKGFMERIDVKPVLDDIELWRIINTAGAIHPIHIHLVQFQIIDRVPFDVDAYIATGQIRFIGKPKAPAENELGWKDTVQCPPGFITRIMMKFGPFTGRYVYHCHILEHEDYDMMRPFEVVKRLCDCGSDCTCGSDCS